MVRWLNHVMPSVMVFAIIALFVATNNRRTAPPKGRRLFGRCGGPWGLTHRSTFGSVFEAHALGIAACLRFGGSKSCRITSATMDAELRPSVAASFLMLVPS